MSHVASQYVNCWEDSTRFKLLYRFLEGLDLHGGLNYSERTLIEKWFQTVTMRIDRFHSFWRGSPASAWCWLRRFNHHYNHDRPNQALDGRTPLRRLSTRQHDH